MRQTLTYPQVDARIAGDDLQWDPRQIGSAQHAGLAERDGEAAYSRAPIGPEGSGLPTDADLRRALALCGVTHLASRLDDEQNWSQRLSLDEQKRLAFARLLVQRPDRIFLDETTSDLDEESALYLYRTLREELMGAMVITVGHLGPLQQLHKAHRSSFGRRVWSEPVPLARRQLQHESRRMCRDALDDIAQIYKRVDLQVLAGLHK